MVPDLDAESPVDTRCKAFARPRPGQAVHPGRRLPEDRTTKKEVVMAELSTRKRKAEPKSDFGLPDERKYPMPDKSHARNAKARASQQEEKGNLSPADKKKVDRKADRILDK